MGTPPADRSGDGAGSLEALRSSLGPAQRPLQRLMSLLEGPPAPLAELVRATTLPRRTVEAVLEALAAEAVRERNDAGPPGGRGAGTGEVATRDGPPSPARAGTGGVPEPAAWRPELELVDAARFPPGLLGAVSELIEGAPPADPALDHVPASADTVLRRALLMSRWFELRGRTVLFVGDHDLTSLALALVEPAARVLIADLDERLLEYLTGVARERALAGLRACFAELRAGLPPSFTGQADLAFTDPPYTPEGVELFVRRGLEGLSDARTGRVLLCYGYGAVPALGWAVQGVLHRLGLVTESLLPAFNRYLGAEAIGSASDLAVLRATPTAAKAIGRTGRAAPGAPRAAIYTHGPQSVETSARPPSAEVLEAIGRRIAGESGEPEPLRVLDAAALLRPAPPQGVHGKDGRAAVVDLRHDPGPLLLRSLLASRAPLLAALVRSSHPDQVDAVSQRALAELVGPRYELQFLRNWPAGAETVVLARERRGEPADAGERARRAVLRRPYAKLANAWREALVESCEAVGASTTKNAARAVVAAHLGALDGEAQVNELPRGELARALDAVVASLREIG